MLGSILCPLLFWETITKNKPSTSSADLLLAYLSASCSTQVRFQQFRVLASPAGMDSKILPCIETAISEKALDYHIVKGTHIVRAYIATMCV